MSLNEQQGGHRLHTRRSRCGPSASYWELSTLVMALSVGGWAGQVRAQRTPGSPASSDARVGSLCPWGTEASLRGALPCQRSCSVGSRDRVSILRERQEPPPGRLAPRVLGPAWLRVQPQQVRSSGRQASERPVPCPPLSTQACLGAVTLPLGVQVWKATFSLGLGEANTEMERLFKSPPPL